MLRTQGPPGIDKVPPAEKKFFQSLGENEEPVVVSIVNSISAHMMSCDAHRLDIWQHTLRYSTIHLLYITSPMAPGNSPHRLVVI